MSNSRPGSVRANGVTRALAEPNQTLPEIKGKGSQSRKEDVTNLAHSKDGSRGLRKRAPKDSGLRPGQDPV
jgi:hypothetical protein